MVRARELPLFSSLALGGNYVWVAHHLLPLVVRVDPIVGVAVDIDVGDKVLDMAFGHGAIWVVTTRSLVRIEADRASVRAITPMDWTGPNTIDGKVADGIIAFDQASVWVSGLFQTALRRVNPATGNVTCTLAVNRSELGMAVGHGTVWVRDGNLIRRLDPDTGKVISTIDPGSRPDDIRIGAEGLWVQMEAGQGTQFVLIEARSEQAMKSIVCERTGAGFQVQRGALWLALHGDDVGDRSTIRRIDIVRRSEAVDIALDGAAWSLAVDEGSAVWATTFRNADRRSRLVGIDEKTRAVEQSFDLNVIDLSPYLPPPLQFAPARRDEVFVFTCRACGLDITRRIGLLNDVPPMPENDIGEYERLDDWVPVGRYFIELGDTAPSEEMCGAAVLNEADLVNTRRDPATWRGCCGADGFDGPNLRCRNGHLVALQKSDCMTLNAVWLLPASTKSREPTRALGPAPK